MNTKSGNDGTTLENGVSSWPSRADAPRSSGSEGSLALDLTEEAVVLCQCLSDGSVEEIANAALDAPDFSVQIEALRNEASRRAPALNPVTLWLPEAQILMRRMSLGSKRREPALAEIALRLQSETEHRPDDLSVDVSIPQDGSPAVVLAALTQTVREAKEYAARWGFVPGAVSTRCHSDAFGVRPPVFGLPEPKKANAGGRKIRFAAAAVLVIGAGVGGWAYYDSLSQVLSAPTIRDVPGQAALVFENADVKPGVRYATPEVIRSDFTDLQQAQPDVPRSRNNRIESGARHSPAAETVAPEILVTPEPAVQLTIGAEPEVPSRKVHAGTHDPAPVTIENGIASVKEAIDRIRTEAQSFAKLPGTSSGPRSDQPTDASFQQEEEHGDNTAELEVALNDVQPLADGSEATPALAEESDAGAEPQLTQDLETEPDTDVAEPEELAAVSPDLPLFPKPKPLKLTERGSEQAAPDTELPENAGEDAPSESTTASPQPEDASNAESRTEESTDEAEATPDDAEEVLAVVTSPQPVKRPEHLSAPDVQVAIRKTKAKPVEAGPSPARVSTAAGENGLRLDETSLIGVIDASSGRRALVRLPDGDFRKLARGDVLDGWLVSSIGRDRMKLTRQGRNRTLDLVSR